MSNSAPPRKDLSPQKDLATRYGAARGFRDDSHRYGARKPRRHRVLVTLTAILGLCGLLAGAVWFSFRPGKIPEHTATQFSAVSPTQARVSIAVVPHASKPLKCAVVATNDFHAVVGYKEVVIPPRAAGEASGTGVDNTDTHGGTDPTQHLRVKVATTQEAANGYIDQCWLMESS